MLYVNLQSILSLVVLAIGETKTLWSFKIQLTKVDLPTFGLPIIQNFNLSSSLFTSDVGISFVKKSNRSPTPILCSAEI